MMMKLALVVCHDTVEALIKTPAYLKMQYELILHLGAVHCYARYLANLSTISRVIQQVNNNITEEPVDIYRK